MGRRRNSSIEPAWAVARSFTPHPAACRRAAQSSPAVISSTAMISGPIVRNTISIPLSFGQPERTSIRFPRRNPDGKSSSRLSTTATVLFCDNSLARSRRSVVFPQPGAPSIKTDFPSPRIPLLIPGKSLATRIQMELSDRNPVILPSLYAGSPLRPMRWPPGAVRKPMHWDSAVQGE